jgi:glycosyltransferase involved in cell wall biosynthesis
VRCVAVSPGGPLYTRQGRRRLLPVLLFAVGVFGHLIRRRRAYDVVHCLSYPYLSLLAVRAALVGTQTRVWVEWLECLSGDWWRRYAGCAGGAAGALLQRACVRLTPRAFAFSRHTESRLREEGFRGELVRLGGLAEPALNREPARACDPELVVFAGRHVPDKGAALVPAAVALLRQSGRPLRAVIAGDGPERERVASEVGRLGLQDVVSMPGFVSQDELRTLLERAACVAAPSRRDGYGMVVAEAAAAGAPVAVCRGPDNAAADRVEEGVNGALAPIHTAEHLAAAIDRVLAGGEELRRSTRDWYAPPAQRSARLRVASRATSSPGRCSATWLSAEGTSSKRAGTTGAPHR